MPELSVTAARDSLADVVNRVAYGHERIKLVRRGRGLAAIVPVEDLELLEALEDELDIEAARAAIADPANRERIAWEQVKADLGL